MLDPEMAFFEKLGVPQRTLYHWRKTRRRNRFAELLWLWFSEGRNPGAGPSWDGWRFWDGQLWSPEGETFTPSDLRTLAFFRRNGSVEQIASAYECERAEV